MIKIAVFNQKGGVGKTTLTVNLASCFSERWHKKVLVCDCDAQCNASDYLLATSEPEENASRLTIFDTIQGRGEEITDIFLHGARKYIKTSISLIRGDRRVDTLDEINLKSLRTSLDAYENKYDFCFLDCSAQKTSINLIALGACDYVLVPVIPDMDSINGYDMVLELSTMLKRSQINPTIEILGILINDVATTGALDSYLMENLGKEFDELIFKSSIRHSLLLRQARYFGLPINYYKKNSNVTLDYYACALEIMERASLLSGKVGK